jgi:hypothetical protein
MRSSILLAAAVICSLSSVAARADSFGVYGDTTVSGTYFDLTSSSTSGSGYSGIYILTNGDITLNAITQLSADYDMINGSFGGGAPRFSIGDTTNNIANEIYAYWGTPAGGGAFNNPIADKTIGNTGNYADLTLSDFRFQINGFGGVNTGNAYLTWSQVVADVGNVAVGFVSVDLDAGFTGDQELLVNNFTLNSDVDSPPVASTPLPAALPLFAGGLGLIGMVGRRKKRKAVGPAVA